MRKSLVILGNGFDKNLGLKTGYWDYFEYASGDKIKKYIEIIINNEINSKFYLKSKILETLKTFIVGDIEKIINDSSIIDVNDIKTGIEKMIDDNKKIINRIDKYIEDDTKDYSLEYLRDYILVNLGFSNSFLISFGLFIQFLLLLEPEYENWYSIEEQIVKYVEDTIDIIEYIYSNDNNIFFEKKDDIKKKIKNFIEELKKSKNYDYSNDILKNYGLIYKLIIKRTEEYKQDKLKEELWESYCNGIVTKIEYINFILENKFLPKLYFKNEEDKKKLRLTSKNDEKLNIDKKYTINLMEYLNYIENDFLKYVENLNIPKISDNEIKKIMGDNELYIINFNYTTYLKEYLEINKHFNYKDMLNINGEIKTDLVIFGIDEIQIQNNHRKKELEKFVKSKKGQKDWKLLIKKCEITDFEEIIFFGHSLADADYSTLKEIFDYFNIKDNENIKLIFKTKDKFYNNHKKEIEHFMARYLGKNHKNVMDKIFCIEIV